jgi:hypothetical protein
MCGDGEEKACRHTNSFSNQKYSIQPPLFFCFFFFVRTVFFIQERKYFDSNLHGKVLVDVSHASRWFIMEGMQLEVFTNNIYSKRIIVVSSCYMNQDQCRYSSVAKCNVKPEDGTRVLQVAPDVMHGCRPCTAPKGGFYWQYVCKHYGYVGRSSDISGIARNIVSVCVRTPLGIWQVRSIHLLRTLYVL